MRRTFTEQFKRDAMARAREVGSRAAAEERGITRSLLMRWAAERGTSCAMVKPDPYAEVRPRALEMAPYHRLGRVARELGVPRTTLSKWLKEAGVVCGSLVQPSRKVRGHRYPELQPLIGRKVTAAEAAVALGLPAQRVDWMLISATETGWATRAMTDGAYHYEVLKERLKQGRP